MPEEPAMQQPESHPVGRVKEPKATDPTSEPESEPSGDVVSGSAPEASRMAQAMSATLVGVDARPVVVEVDLANRLPSIQTVGLPMRAVKESEDRVRAAIVAGGFEWPKKRVVINLAPADLPKSGTGFDLPIAVAVLRAHGKVSEQRADDYLLIGELGLDGRLRPVPGVLAATMAAREAGLDGVIVPLSNGAEASLVDDVHVVAAETLADVAGFLDGKLDPPPVPGDAVDLQNIEGCPDLSDVRGLEWPRCALEIAAAGGHNLMLVGPPGTGKSMMARRLPSILPPLTREEALEVTRIHSAGGALAPGMGMVRRRPFRSPHHTVTPQALAGGGVPIRPGEITLAHRGVLYLDEIPEFPRAALEVLRQPLEDQAVVVARASQRVVFPADFQLVATANPCPCGFAWDRQRPCQCNPHQVQVYQGRTSGPLLDRIDLFAEVPRIAYEQLGSEAAGEASAVVRERVVAARQRQLARLDDRPQGQRSNARLTKADIEVHCRLDRGGRDLMRQAVDDGYLSPRAHDRVLRVARTVADLADRDRISDADVLDAVELRVGGHPLERKDRSSMPASA